MISKLIGLCRSFLILFYVTIHMYVGEDSPFSNSTLNISNDIKILLFVILIITDYGNGSLDFF